MKEAYLLLGSNEGERRQWLQKGIDLVAATCGTITKQSFIYETAPWGLEEQPDFLNIAICVATVLSPMLLLQAIQQIELSLGRQRQVKWGQRTLDIDILLYANEIIHLPELQVPHAFLQERRFALAPLAEIAPTLVHPQLNKTITQLLAECPDLLEVRVLHT